MANGKNTKVNWLCEKIRKLSDEGFYGSLTIKMENGHIQRIIREESEVPPREEKKALQK